MITLKSGTATITLPADLYWSDEHDWQPVEQSVNRTITGALIVESALRVGGRPITLAPEDDSSAWISLANLDLLHAWAAIPGKEMQLTIRGVERPVIFRHHDSSGISARPVVHYSAPESTDFYLATVRFMEIE